MKALTSLQILAPWSFAAEIVLYQDGLCMKLNPCEVQQAGLSLLWVQNT